eukprot:gene8852-10326_t
MLQLAVPIHRLAVALNPRSLQLWRCVGVASKQLTAYFGQPNSSICRCYATPFSTAVPYRDTSDPQLSSQFIMPVGLKKFFPEGSAWDEINVGRRWKTRELRAKSDVDLHKLWYVLLIERNKLLTVKMEARRCGEEMPGQLRYKKVKQAMNSILVVLRERREVRRMAANSDESLWKEARQAHGLEPVSSVYTKPARRALSPGEARQLYGIVPPNRSRPGQPERPMKKRERTIFRRRLERARFSAEQEEANAYAEKLSVMSDDDLRSALDAVALELVEGSNLKNLTMKSKVCLREARRRGISPI